MKYRVRAIILPEGTLISEAAFHWNYGMIREILMGQIRVVVGVFPARDQGDGVVYGGRPMSADVLWVMSHWGLTQEDAVGLMDEEE